MPEKEWTLPRGNFAILVRRHTVAGKIQSFAVVLLTIHEGNWIDISRYDTAHGFAHRDVLGLNEGLRGKLPCHNLTYEQAFRYAISDFEQNAEIIFADFLAH